MKNILIAASMLAFAVSGADAQRIEPINKVVDCGQVTYQTPVTAEFEIKNKDNHSIRISNVRTSCGCTSVDYPKGEIVGDAAFMVRVTYDAQTMDVSRSSSTFTPTTDSRPSCSRCAVLW